jgi:hypothetical protein
MADNTTISGGVWGGYAYPITGRIQAAGFGTADACMAVSGQLSNPAGTTVTTELSNGITWSSSTSLSVEVQVSSGVGTSTAGGVLMGQTGSAPTAIIRLFNGTTWSNGASNSVATYFAGGFGQSTTACGQTAGLLSGGIITSNTYLYNGTAWSTGSTSAVIYANGSAGTQTDAVTCGGLNSSAISQVVAYKYNGTTWSATGNMVTQKDRHVVFGASSSLVVASGGNIGGPQPTERFTGTSWAQVGTAIGVRYQRPTSSSQAATTGIAVSGNTATGGVFQWGAEKYYN